MLKKISLYFFIFFWVFNGIILPVKAQTTPNDPYFQSQWYLGKIKANYAWDKLHDGQDMIVAVIDSGIQIDHPDLRSNIWSNTAEIPDNGIDDDSNGFIDDYHGWDFVENSPDPSPRFGDDASETGLSHGTTVSGIIGAIGNNGRGVSGVAWKIKIMPLRTLDDKGEGRVGDVIRAVDYATANGADIINLSFVGFNYSEALQESLERAYKAGVIIVAAAGNDQGRGAYNTDQTPLYPACYSGSDGENIVIGVSATDAFDQKAVFSSYGSRCVDISAPGSSFFNLSAYSLTFADGHYDRYYDGFWSGTSMATPLVSGALALIKQINPELNSREIVDVLLRSADNIDNLNPSYLGQLGSGRLNLFNALTWAQEKLYVHSGRLLLHPNKGANPLARLKITNLDGSVVKEFWPYGQNFKGGISITSSDINGDGKEEIITAPLSGATPEVRIFDENGNLKNKFLAFDASFRGGVNIVAGDFDGNGHDEIAVAPNSLSAPEIRIFDGKGKLKIKFLAYDKSFRGGVNLAAGDLNGDSRDEIVSGPGISGGPHIRVFNNSGKILSQFFAYSKNTNYGVKVAVANIYGRQNKNRPVIISAPASGNSSQIGIFDIKGNSKGRFSAYGQNFKGGVNLTAGDLNNDGLAEIITGAGPGGSPHVRIFKANGDLIDSYYAYKEVFDGGVSVGSIQVNN